MDITAWYTQILVPVYSRTYWSFGGSSSGLAGLWSRQCVRSPQQLPCLLHEAIGDALWQLGAAAWPSLPGSFCSEHECWVFYVFNFWCWIFIFILPWQWPNTGTGCPEEAPQEARFCQQHGPTHLPVPQDLEPGRLGSPKDPLNHEARPQRSRRHSARALQGRGLSPGKSGRRLPYRAPSQKPANRWSESHWRWPIRALTAYRAAWHATRVE